MESPKHDPKQTVPGLTSVYQNGHLAPRVLQITGLIVLIASVVFWMVTGAQSVLMVSAALSLIGVGSYTSQINQLKHNLVAKQHTEAANGADA